MARAWRLVAGGTTLLALCALLPAAAPYEIPYTAADMEAAHGPDAVKIKDALLAPLPTFTVVTRADYASKVVREFEPELTSANPDARLNTAVVFGSFGTITCDKILETMLTNSDPAVRLWGAKGLAAIADILKKIGGSSLTRATAALKTADSTESSAVVKDQIEKTLALF